MKPLKLDFTTTAMARPEILDQTYASFSKNLININLKDCRLFINIDPLPEKVNCKLVTKVAKKYFKKVYPNYPSIANHSAALNWTWSQATSEYIFNLEDDWILKKEINMIEIMNIFKNKPDLQMIALRAYDFPYDKYPLSPGIMNKSIYQKVAGKLKINTNPELQLRGKNFGISMPSSLEIKYQEKVLGHPQKTIVLKDIGRRWLKLSKYKRSGKHKARKITWVKK